MPAAVGKPLAAGGEGQIEEKNCRDRFSQLFWSASIPVFFLQHSSTDSLQELLFRAEAAEISRNNEPVRTMTAIAIRKKLLLIFVDLII